MSLADPLHKNDDDACGEDADSLRAALHDREVQLQESLAVGNRLMEERADLEAQINDYAEKEAQTIASHKREVNSLSQQLHDALCDAERLKERATELQSELHDAQDQTARYRDQFNSLRSANEALRADMQQQEREQDDIRSRSTMQESVEEQNSDLKSRVQQLERELQTAKANASGLVAQREADRTNWQRQQTELRDKLQTLQSELDRTRRESATERARLQAAVRDAQHAAGIQTSTPSYESRRTTGPTAAPSVPQLKLEEVNDNKLDRDYQAFSARARGLSTATTFTLGADRATLPPPPPGHENGPREMRRHSRRRLADTDSDEGDELEPLTEGTAIPIDDVYVAPRNTSEESLQQQHHRRGAPAGGENQHAAEARRSSRRGSVMTGSGRCPTCGRHDEEPRTSSQQHRRDTQQKRKDDRCCPCAVM